MEMSAVEAGAKYYSVNKYPFLDQRLCFVELELHV